MWKKQVRVAEGAERFRGLWEDEMFARQGENAHRPSSAVASGIAPPLTPPPAYGSRSPVWVASV